MSTASRAAVWLGALALAVWVHPACTDDTDDAGVGGQGGSVQGGSGGSGGSTGSGGAGGSAGTGGTDGGSGGGGAGGDGGSGGSGGSFADVPRDCVVSGCEDFIVPEGLGCSCDLACVPDVPGVELSLRCVDPSPDPIACKCLADGVEFRSFEAEVGGVGAPDCSAYQTRCFPEP